MTTSSPLRVLHAVESWRPRVSGYTIRSEQLITAQARADDLDPYVVVSSRQQSYGVTGADVPEGLAGRIDAVQPSARERVVRRARGFYLDAGHQERALAAAARRVRPHLLHGHWSSGLGMAAARAAAAAQIPFVAEVRFDLAGVVMTETVRRDLPWLEGALRRRFERHLARAAAVIAASYTLADLLRAQVPGVPAVHVVPNGVDVEVFAPGPSDPALRASLGLEGAVVVGSTSTMQRYEGLDRLIRAADAARQRVPELAVLLVGSGVQEAELRALAQTVDVPVVFAGHVPTGDVPRYLREIDVFGVPRLDATVTRYASPLKLIEALAAGCAVVGSRVGDVPILLDDGRGLLVPPGDDAALADALVAAARAERRRALGASARAYAETAVTWTDTARLTADVYRAIMPPGA